MTSGNARTLAGPAATVVGGSRTQHASSGDIAVGVVVGRVAQSFDTFVFGLGCVLVFPDVFFPFASHVDGLFYSFAMFALGFVARPLGSTFFLLVHRQFGKTVKLTAALFLIGIATVGVAFLPGYDTIGMVAIAALAFLRFGQGFALGGSWSGLASLGALKAPEGRSGWYQMLPQLGGPCGFIVAAGLFAFLWSSLSHQEFLAWGWRYPFFVAFAVNVVALFARLRMVVAPEYEEQLAERDLEPSPVIELVRTQGRNIVLGAFAPLASYALFYLVTIFGVTWALLFTQQSVVDFLIVQIIGAGLAIVCMFISGWVADRIGRRATLGAGGALIAVYSGWTALLLSGGTTPGYIFILLGFALLGFTHAQSAGAVSSRFPSEARFTGAMLTSDLGWLIGAGFAPLAALALAVYAGIDYVGLYLLSGAVGTLAALWITRRGKVLSGNV